MLIFKKNIYFINYAFNRQTPFRIEMGDNEGPRPIAYNFLFTALAGDRTLFLELNRIDPDLARERLRIFFPNASRFGDLAILNTLSKRLLRGLLNNRVWYQLNCYHFCYLYDTLMNLVEDYSYGDRSLREQLFPEMQGRPINFNQFLNEYFFHTVFLIDPRRFNSLSRKEQLRLGRIDHSLFGVLPVPDPVPDDEDPTLARVINRIPPGPDEIELEIYPGNPYWR